MLQKARKFEFPSKFELLTPNAREKRTSDQRLLAKPQMHKTVATAPRVDTNIGV
jgi:hypothetical protein